MSDLRLLLTIISIVAGYLLASGRAHCQTPDDVHVARACKLETEYSERDCAAQWGVALNRATMPKFRGKGPVYALVKYTRLYTRTNPRARRIARMPGDDMLISDWTRFLSLARRVMAGEIRDPCRGRAWHWRGPNDPPSKRRKARCGPGLKNDYRMLAWAK